MKKENEEIELKELIEDFIHILEVGDESSFVDIWHPRAIRFGLGNTNELMAMNKEEIIKFSLKGIQGLRKQISGQELVKFQIDEIIQINVVEGLIANAELKWHMILPGSKGSHHTFIQFAKDNQKWFIVNVLDKGFEKLEG